ncbi:MAG TPA: hypothetical protein VGP16_06745, partial [Asanoa sp.]|nr:hypothetical protein [Asanoa sp.]
LKPFSVKFRMIGPIFFRLRNIRPMMIKHPSSRPAASGARRGRARMCPEQVFAKRRCGRSRQLMILRQAAQDMIEQAEAAESSVNALANEPIEKAENADPTEPMLPIDPIEPIERIEPFEPMLSTESSERIESMAPSLPRMRGAILER